jgi:hypothetical protein
MWSHRERERSVGGVASRKVVVGKVTSRNQFHGPKEQDQAEEIGIDMFQVLCQHEAGLVMHVERIVEAERSREETRRVVRSHVP